LNCPFSPTTVLTLSKAASPTDISAGVTSPVTYTINVTNTGTYSASGVVIDDTDFASWMTVTNVTSTAGTVTFTSSSFEVRITSLAIGATATITVSVSATPPSIQTFTNNVTGFATNAPSTSGSALLNCTVPTSTPTNTPTRTPTFTPTFTRTFT